MTEYEKLMNTAIQCGIKIITDDFCITTGQYDYNTTLFYFFENINEDMQRKKTIKL